MTESSTDLGPSTGKGTKTWVEQASSTMMNAFGQPLDLLVRGEGAYVWDAEGKRYLDFLGGIAVNALGHAHPVFVEAVSSQAATLAHVSNYFVTPANLELSERLLRLAGAEDDGKVFFTNSGTEAVEAAVKLARLHGNQNGKSTLLALEGAFHGRSIGALSLTSKEKYREPFGPLLPGAKHIEPTLAALEESFDDDVAALFVEPIQGEAGVRELPSGYLDRARELADQHGALLIFDEVQTGAGRTGQWFAWQNVGVRPDAVTLAKGLAGGFPIGALLAFGPAADLFTPGLHGTTFGGNPLATHTANRVLQFIEDEDILTNVKARSGQIRQGVEDLPGDLVKGTSGEGLLIGVKLTRPVAAEVAKAAFDRGLIVNAPAEDVIRIAPPLVISEAEVEEFLDLFGKALADCA